MKRHLKTYKQEGLPGGANEVKSSSETFIVSSEGQYKYPGMNTMIPNANGRITMKGVGYPLLGIDDEGNSAMMQPGGEYQFPGNDVYEIPLSEDEAMAYAANGYIVEELKNGGEDEIIRPRGDKYEYKKVGDKYYTRKREGEYNQEYPEGEGPGWDLASGEAEDAIKYKVFKEEKPKPKVETAAEESFDTYDYNNPKNFEARYQNNRKLDESQDGLKSQYFNAFNLPLLNLDGSDPNAEYNEWLANKPVNKRVPNWFDNNVIDPVSDLYDKIQRTDLGPIDDAANLINDIIVQPIATLTKDAITKPEQLATETMQMMVDGITLPFDAAHEGIRTNIVNPDAEFDTSVLGDPKSLERGIQYATILPMFPKVFSTGAKTAANTAKVTNKVDDAANIVNKAKKTIPRKTATKPVVKTQDELLTKIQQLKKDGIISPTLDEQILINNPNLVDAAVRDGIKKQLTVNRSVFTGDDFASQAFPDQTTEALYSGSHTNITSGTAQQRAGLQQMSRDNEALYAYKGKRPTSDPVNTDYGSHTVEARIPFDYTGNTDELLSRFNDLKKNNIITRDRNIANVPAKDIKPGVVIDEVAGEGTVAKIGEKGEKVLDPIKITTDTRYTELAKTYNNTRKDYFNVRDGKVDLTSVNKKYNTNFETAQEAEDFLFRKQFDEGNTMFEYGRNRGKNTTYKTTHYSPLAFPFEDGGSVLDLNDSEAMAYAEKGYIVEELYEGGDGGGTHTVKSGDTFNAIAYANGISPAELAAANPKISADKLSIGQVLNIPEAAKVEENTVEEVEVSETPTSLSDLYLKQAFAESSFRPDVITGTTKSSKGAQGLAQFMPDTMKDMVRLGIVDESFDPYDPAQAAAAQIGYMNWISGRPYLNKGEDFVKNAKFLSGYNLGVGNVKDALTKAKKAGIDIYNTLDWLNKDYVPQETIDYIDRITGQDEEFDTRFNKAVSDTTNKYILDLYSGGGNVESSLDSDMAMYSTILDGIGAPASDENIKFLKAWRQAEGGTASNNPFNTTLDLDLDQDKTDYNSVGVKNYSTPEYGIAATIKTLRLNYYKNIVAGLQNDIGASNIASNTDELKTWGTGKGVARVLNGGKIKAPKIAQYDKGKAFEKQIIENLDKTLENKKAEKEDSEINEVLEMLKFLEDDKDIPEEVVKQKSNETSNKQKLKITDPLAYYIYAAQNTPSIQEQVQRSMAMDTPRYIMNEGGFIPHYDHGGKHDEDELITYKNNKSKVDGTADWNWSSDVDISSAYNDQIKARLLTGNYGYNSKTGELVKLGKSQQTKVTDKEALDAKKALKETAGMSSKEYEIFQDNERDAAKQNAMDDYTSNRKLVSIDKVDEWNPSFTIQNESGQDINTQDYAGKQVYMTPAEEAAYKKAVINQNIPATTQKMNSVGRAAASVTPIGMAVNAMEGITGLAQDLPALIENPSWSNAVNFVVDAAEASPFVPAVVSKAKPFINQAVAKGINKVNDIVTKVPIEQTPLSGGVNPDMFANGYNQSSQKNIQYQHGGPYNVPSTYANALKTFTDPNYSTVGRTGYNALTNTITYDPNSKIENVNNDWWKEHEKFHHLQNLAGGLSTSGIVGKRPNPYVASDMTIKSYYDRRDSDIDNTVDEMIKKDPSLQFIPKDKLIKGSGEGFIGAESLQYANPDTVEGEARAYENYIREGNPSIFELTDKEAKQYRAGGYVLEELQEGGEDDIIRPKGDSYEYKKVGDKYYTRKTEGEWNQEYAEGDGPKWNLATGDAQESIKTKVYKETPIAKNTTKDSSEEAMAGMIDYYKQSAPWMSDADIRAMVTDLTEQSKNQQKSNLTEQQQNDVIYNKRPVFGGPSSGNTVVAGGSDFYNRDKDASQKVFNIDDGLTAEEAANEFVDFSVDNVKAFTVDPIVRTAEKIYNEPGEFADDVMTTGSQLMNLPINLGVQLGNVAFGSGNFDANNVVDMEALGTTLDATSLIPVGQLLGQGVRTGAKVAPKIINKVDDIYRVTPGAQSMNMGFISDVRSAADDLKNVVNKVKDKVVGSTSKKVVPKSTSSVPRGERIDPPVINRSLKVKPEKIQERMGELYKSGKYWDEVGIPGDQLVYRPEMINYKGTYSGRPIVEVNMPDGSKQFFYKSSGWAGKAGEGAGGTTEGMWQVYGGHSNNPRVGGDNWFIKTSDYKNYYGSDTYKGIAGELDNALMKKYEVGNLDELDELINFQNRHSVMDTYTPGYKQGGYTLDLSQDEALTYAKLGYIVEEIN